MAQLSLWRTARVAAGAAVALLAALPNMSLGQGGTPNLSVTSLTPPASIPSGATVTAAWTVANLGSATATGPWREDVYGSPDGGIGGDFLLASFTYAGTLAPGESVLRVEQIFVPAGIPPGNYSAVVCVDGLGQVAESNEADNCGIAPVCVGCPVPDWIVVSAVAPAECYQQVQTEFRWTIRNQGSSAANATWSDQLGLSSDGQAGGDFFLGSISTTANLGPGQELELSAYFPIPDGVVGPHFVLVQTDSSNAVLEPGGEENNYGVSALTTEVFDAPPAEIEEIFSREVSINFAETTPPVSGSIAEIFSREFSVNFADTPPVTSGAIAEVFSREFSVNFDDTPAVVSGSIAEIFSREFSVNFSQEQPITSGSIAEVFSREFSLHFDPNAPPPTAVQLDVISREFSVFMSGADLIAEQVTAPGQAVAGASLTLHWHETNQGPLAATGPWRDQIYASSNATIGDADDLAIGSAKVYSAAEQLAAYDTVARSHTVTLPTNLSGTRWFYVRVDSASEELEQDEANNATLALGSTFVEPEPKPDLAILSLSAPPIVPDGEPALLQLQLANLGTAPLHPSVSSVPVQFRLWLSGDASLGGDTLLDLPVSLLDLDPGESTNASFSVTVPAGLNGNYWFLAEADINNAVLNESSESNNFAATAAPSLVQQPDLPNLVLVAGTWSVANEGLLAQQLTPAFANTFYVDTQLFSTWTVQNKDEEANGKGTANGTWKDRVFLSADPVFDAGVDTLVGEFQFSGTRAPGQTYLATANLEMPSVAGTYWLLLVLDADSSLPESGPADNQSALQITVEEPAWRATISTPVSEALAAKSASEGLSIPVAGQAIDLQSGAPKPFVPVTYRVQHKNTRRVFDALSSADGSWSDAYFPLPDEAGEFRLYADHPAVTENAVLDLQDAFTLFGLRFDPSSVTTSLITTQLQAKSVVLRNLGDTPVGPISYLEIGEPSHLALDLVNAPSVLDAGASSVLVLQIDALADAPNSSVPAPMSLEARIDLNGQATTAAALALPTYVTPLTPKLVPSTTSLLAGVLKGDQTIVSFTLTNTGGAPATDVRVVLPCIEQYAVDFGLPGATPCLASMVSDPNLGELAPGASVPVEIAILPSAAAPTGQVVLWNGAGNGAILIESAELPDVQVGYAWEITSEAKGGLTVRVEDELTYWSEQGTYLEGGSGPKVEGASVTLTKPLIRGGNLSFQGLTGATGEVTLSDLPEGFYNLLVSAPGHGSYATIVEVKPGQTQLVPIFVSIQTVNYEWTVEPTQIEDEYKITIEATFTVIVPAPIITVSPALIDLDLSYGETQQLTLTVSNQGLVAAQAMELVTNPVPGYTITPLITQIGDLAANMSIQIPVLLSRDDAPAGSSSSLTNCDTTVSWGLRYYLFCGELKSYWVPIYYQYPSETCGGAVGGGTPGGGGVTGGPGGPPPVYNPPTFIVEINCEIPPNQSLVPTPCEGCDCGMLASGNGGAGAGPAGGGPSTGGGAPGHGPTTRPPEPAGLAQARGTDPVLLFSGEMVLAETDLYLRGRGLDFAWKRHYLSRRNGAGPQGHGWSYGFDIQMERDGQDVLLREGSGRFDRYQPAPGNIWVAEELFREFSRNPDGSYTLRFPDLSTWVFFPVDGSAISGRLSRVVDRNGNRIALLYDAAGRLTGFLDTLDRAIALEYDVLGRIASVSDFSGRVVSYEYDAAGDLISVTGPPVTGVVNELGPSDHVEYPEGQTVHYSYSNGFADERLNHNLISVTDAKGQTYLVNTYHPTTDHTNRNFDRVIAQQWGDPGDITNLYYLPLVPSIQNDQAVMKTIVNDRVGNVAEYDFDLRNRLIKMREYSGRAPNADLETTLVTNRPGPPLREGDPLFWETCYGYDQNSRATVVTHPNASVTRFVYEKQLDPNAPQRLAGNLREIHREVGSYAGPITQLAISEYLEYEPNTGGCCGSNFIKRYTDPEGHVTEHVYDALGNRIQTLHPIPGIAEDWEYNSFGQVASYTWPSNTDSPSGHRQRDEYSYFAAGPSKGYLREEVRDATGFAYVTTYEYDSRGNPTEVTDPRGNDTRYAYNALDQLVREESAAVTLPAHEPSGSPVRYAREYVYDANGNLIRQEIENRDRFGALSASHPVIVTSWIHETLNRVASMTQEVGPGETITTEYEYDENRNRILERSPIAVAGLQPDNVTAWEYDTRDLLLRTRRAPGSAIESITRHDYDGNRNLVLLVEGETDPAERNRRTSFDAFDRPIERTDPMGNVERTEYDASGDLVRRVFYGELLDVEGSTDNVRLSETHFTYDPMHRLVLENEAWFDPETQEEFDDGARVDAFAWSHRGQRIRVTDDLNQSTAIEYDSAARPVRATDPAGNWSEFAYDANGNRLAQIDHELSTSTGSSRTITQSWNFDPKNRAIHHAWGLGVSKTYEFDSRDNRVRVVDGMGHERLRAYDALDRMTEDVTPLVGVPGQGPSGSSIRNFTAYDQNSRTVSREDGNGNRTSYQYDSLDRLLATVNADNTVHQIETYDVHGSATSIQDENGTRYTQEFDLLGRMSARNLVSAPAEVVQSNPEYRYVYQGNGLVRSGICATDIVERDYDSLRNLVNESGNDWMVSAAWTSKSALAGYTIAGEPEVSLSLDSLDRVTSAHYGATAVAFFDYLGREMLERAELGPDVIVETAYDSVRRPTELKASVAGNVIVNDRYTWDAAFRRTHRESLHEGIHRSYDYDSAHRMVGFSLERGGVLEQAVAWTLDAAGNWTNVAGDLYAGQYTLDSSSPDPADFQVNAYTETPSGSWQYTQSGQAISETALGGGSVYEFQYDWLGFPVRAVQSATARTIGWSFDAFGRRTRVSVADQASALERKYHYLEDRLVASTVDGTTSTLLWSPGNHRVAMELIGDAQVILVTDDQGSVLATLGAAGSETKVFDYTPFGRMIDRSSLLPIQLAAAPSIGFLSHFADGDLDIFPLGARLNDSRTGRFLSRDPGGAWSDPHSRGNAYTYGANAPSTFWDYNGLDAVGYCPSPLHFEEELCNDILGPTIGAACGLAAALPGAGKAAGMGLGVVAGLSCEGATRAFCSHSRARVDQDSWHGRSCWGLPFGLSYKKQLRRTWINCPNTSCNCLRESVSRSSYVVNVTQPRCESGRIVEETLCVAEFKACDGSIVRNPECSAIR